MRPLFSEAESANMALGLDESELTGLVLCCGSLYLVIMGPPQQHEFYKHFSHGSLVAGSFIHRHWSDRRLFTAAEHNGEAQKYARPHNSKNSW